MDKGENLQGSERDRCSNKNLLMEAVGKGLGRGRSVNEDWVAQGIQKWREGDIYIKREETKFASKSKIMGFDQ